MATLKTAEWWAARRFGCISLALSLAEIAAIGAAILVVHSSRHHEDSECVASDMWLLGGIEALGFAMAGLVADTKHSPHFSPSFSLF
jgi:hypothetical protein